MRELTYTSLLLIILSGTAKAQSDNQFLKSEPNHQNTYLSTSEASLNNLAVANLNNPVELSRFAICDKITAHTEFTSQGIWINPRFTLKNAANKKLRLTAYFYYAEDTPMPASYPGYSTSNYQLATWKDIEPTENETNINLSAPYNFNLLMPYNKMGLNRNLLNLKYFLSLFDGDEKIQESDWIYFRITDSRLLLSQSLPN